MQRFTDLHYIIVADMYMSLIKVFLSKYVSGSIPQLS